MGHNKDFEFENVVVNHLNNLGIKSWISQYNFVCIDRTSMCEFSQKNDESACYKEVLDIVKSVFPDLRIMWDSRNDEFMSIGVY